METHTKLHRRLFYLIFGIAIFCLHFQSRVSKSPSTYKFLATGNQLFAIGSTGSYGSENGVWTSDDLGETWTPFHAPTKTLSLDAEGRGMLALTSTHQVWRRNPDTKSWNQVTTLPGSHHYSILGMHDGSFFVGAPGKITWHQENGSLIKIFEAQNADNQEYLFGDLQFADAKQDFVIAVANPYTFYLIDITKKEMRAWAEGWPAPTEGWSGVADIIHMGDRYFATHFHHGTFAADGLGGEWKLLCEEYRFGGNLLDDTSRDIAAYKPESGEWLYATDSGIHLMNEADKTITIYSDSARGNQAHPDHYLILQIAPHGGYYFVSFSRLQNDCMGIRIDGDLNSWRPMFMRRESP